MEPIPAAIIVGSLSVAGNWAAGKTPSMTNAIGIGGIAVGLALFAQVNEKMASAFAWLIIIGMAAIHLPAIVKGSSLGKAR